MGYLAQQIVNGIHLGALYALLAFACAISHGVLRRASFVHGALFAFAGQLAVHFTSFGWNTLGLVLPAALAVGAIAALIYTAAAARFIATAILQPVRNASANMTIALSLAVMIVMMEAVRLSTGNWSPWLMPFLNTPTVIGGDTFTITTTPLKLVETAISAAVIGAGSLVLARSVAGRIWRAVCQDEAAAALLGIDPRAVFIASMTVSGLVAAIAGILTAWHYGNIDFGTGLTFAVKILFLTSLGGLSSPALAAAGGLAIGVFETLWDGCLPIQWRDIATYSLLCAALIATRRQNSLGN